MARNKYPEQTVEKILDVSQELFLEKGYEQTTIQDIVNHLEGLSKGAIYHHFKSKDEILAALEGRIYLNDNPFEKVSEFEWSAKIAKGNQLQSGKTETAKE